MSQDAYPVPKDFQARAHITEPRYQEMYQRSVDDPEGFWSEQAHAFLTWSGTWKKVLDWDFKTGYVRWFEGGRLNACYNCVDRHLAARGEQAAIVWEGNEPGENRSITYRELYEQVCRPGRSLRSPGVDRQAREVLAE